MAFIHFRQPYSYIEQGMKQWQIPGLAIVIVKDGKVVVNKGYGLQQQVKVFRLMKTHYFLLPVTVNYLQAQHWPTWNTKASFRSTIRLLNIIPITSFMIKPLLSWFR